MDPESKKMLEETFRLSEENNRMLRRMLRFQKWTTLWKIFYGVVILGIAVGAFYYLNPYLESLMNIYSSVSGVEERLTGGGGSFQGFLNSLKK